MNTWCSDRKGIDAKCEDLPQRRIEMSRETWIRNVLRIYPEKTREQAEELFARLFNGATN